MRTTHRITSKHYSFITLVIVITWLDFGEVLLETVILANFLEKKFGYVFSRSNTILAISQEWLVRLMWNKKELHPLHTGYIMWPWPLTSLMTLTLHVSRSHFEITVSQELLVWLIWNEKVVSNMILGQLYDHALWPHPWPWPWNFKVRVWNSYISGMGRPIDMERKGCDSSIRDHDID